VKHLQWQPKSVDGVGPPIRTSITDTEASRLRDLARDGHVLEIGSAFGYSTVVMAQTAIDVTSIDPHIALESREILRSNLQLYGVAHKVTCVVHYSWDILPLLPPGLFDLVFIDGDHSEAAVWRDIALSLPLIKLGGHIACHDYDEDTCPGIKPPCDQLLPGGVLTDTLWAWRRDAG
jgi:predicted O-methyltransferase YrrM